MPMREYLEWQEFYEIEPFGLQVMDAMHAHPMALFANVNRNDKVRSEPFTTKDFLMFPPEEKADVQADEPTVDGMTADQWNMLHFFQHYQRRREHEKELEREKQDPVAGMPGDGGDRGGDVRAGTRAGEAEGADAGGNGSLSGDEVRGDGAGGGA